MVDAKEPTETTVLIDRGTSKDSFEITSAKFYVPKDGKELKKSIGLFQSLACLFGLLFGSGVFISPGLVAKQTNSMGMALLIWIISGTICTFGALCFCELAGALKKTGSEFLFLKEAYGDVAGFCLIWAQTFVIYPTSVAVISIVIGEYCVSPFYDASILNGIWLIKS